VQSHAMPHIERCIVMDTKSADISLKNSLGEDHTFKIAAAVSPS
jgi:hypothetical protein